MNGLPVLPPVYRPEPVAPLADPFLRARFAAAHGAPDGALYWSRREDRMACALVLRPEGPAADSLPAALVAMLALGDAVSALAAPGVDLQLGWPDRLIVNGATAGRLRADWEEGWIVLGLTVSVMLDPDHEPGRTPDRTTLHDEGCGEITAAGLLESFSRHFLHWLDRWQEEGFGAVRSAWRARAGERAGLDDRGDLPPEPGEAGRMLSLAAALKAPDRGR